MHREANLTSPQKKVKRQCTIIILATLVDLPDDLCKIQPQEILGSREKDF